MKLLAIVNPRHPIDKYVPPQCRKMKFKLLVFLTIKQLALLQSVPSRLNSSIDCSREIRAIDDNFVLLSRIGNTAAENTISHTLATT